MTSIMRSLLAPLFLVLICFYSAVVSATPIDAGFSSFVSEKVQNFQRSAQSGLVSVTEQKDAPRQAYIVAATKTDLSGLTQTSTAALQEKDSDSRQGAGIPNTDKLDRGRARPIQSSMGGAAKII